MEGLEHEAELLAPQERLRVVAKTCDFSFLKENPSGIDRLEPRDHVEQGRFADARVADHGDILAGGQIERNGVQHRAHAEPLGDCGEPQHLRIVLCVLPPEAIRTVRTVAHCPAVVRPARSYRSSMAPSPADLRRAWCSRTLQSETPAGAGYTAHQ